MYNAKSEELYDAEEQIRNERAKVTKAEEQRRNDQKKRAHLRYQKEIAILQTQLSESEKKRHGCRLSTALDPKALEALGLETISDYVTFQNEFDLQLNLKKLFLQYNELKEDFKKKLEIEVNKQLTEMQKKLEDYKKEVELLNEARECVTDAFIRIQALLKEKDEYLRLLEVCLRTLNFESYLGINFGFVCLCVLETQHTVAGNQRRCPRRSWCGIRSTPNW
jgi:hypothetical protein